MEGKRKAIWQFKNKAFLQLLYWQWSTLCKVSDFHINQCDLFKALKFWDPDLSTTSDQFFIFSLKYDQYKVINAWLSKYVRLLDNTLDQE